MNVFEGFVGQGDYPCLGARSVLKRRRATVRPYAELGAAGTAPALLADLRRFAGSADPKADLVSFVATFQGPRITDEQQFEELLWRQLQLLNDLDPEPWNPSVSPDPADPHFGFSAAGTAFFVVGLHPSASRLARRAPTPMLVFNLHEQFQRLRGGGGYDRMRETIRRRDRKFQGNNNPMVADHGEISEARQYSGRAVPAGWRAPFTATGMDGSA